LSAGLSRGWWQASLVAEEKRLEEAIKEHSGQIALLQDSILKANAEEEAANSNRRVISHRLATHVVPIFIR
jgi:hypothetical protein